MPALRNKGIAARWAALSPGGPVTQQFLADHQVVLQVGYLLLISHSGRDLFIQVTLVGKCHIHSMLQVGSTVFVHAGVLPEHAIFGLERMNT